MKKIAFAVLLVYVLALFSPLAMLGTSAQSEMPEDYIAAWDFETETGGKITDISGNGYHGAIRVPTYMSRQAGQGYAGSTALVISTAVTGNDTQMNAPGLGNVIKEKRQISISGWYKYEGTFDKERYIFNIPNWEGYTGLAASVLADGRIKFQVRTTAASPNHLKAVQTHTSITMPNNWVHLTFMVNMPAVTTGKATLAIYINGVKVVEDTNVDVNGMTSLETLGSPAEYDFRLGGQGSAPFIGRIDDVKIYDRVLTQAEIAALSTPMEEPDPIEPEDDYIAAWDFETETGGKITDISGNGYHGVIRIPTYMSRQAGQGYGGSTGLVISTAVTGSDTQMNAPGLGNVIKGKRQISIAGWYKYEGAFDKERYIFNVPNSEGYTGLAASVLADKTIKFQVRTTASSGNLKSITTPPNIIMPNDWVHLTFIVSMPAESTGRGTLAIYVNGVKATDSTNVDVNGMTSLSTLGSPAEYDFRLGGQGSYPFIGRIDDVKVYDRVLTQAEITALATPIEEPETPIDPELVLQYDFEELTGDNKVVDTSGKGNHGTFSSAGIYQSVGYRGKGAHADAVSDTYVYSDKVMQHIDGANAITVAGWFNNDVLTSSTDFNFFNILIDGGNAGFKANINKAQDTSASQKIVVGGRSIKDDSWLACSTNFTWQTSKQWHHFAFVIDYKNKYLGVFIDGEERASGTAAFKSNKFVLGSPQAHAARFGGGGSATFNGYMDEIKVYNYRLTNNDIMALASDTRVATQITSFKIGEVEYASLEGAKITDPSDEFGAVVPLAEAVEGIEYAIESPVDAKAQLYINDVLVSDLASATVKPGDVVVLMVEGDLWEEPQGYKISFGNHPLQATPIVATDRYGARTNYKTEGKMTFKTKVKNNAQTDTVKLLAALYDIDNRLLLDVSLSEQEVPAGSVKEFSTSLTLPQNYNEVELKVFVWNKDFVPVRNTTVFELAPVNVTELSMPSIFGSNSVLQRDEPVNIFGKAVPGSVVSVSFAGHEVETTADFKGDFIAVLPAMPANSTGQTLTVSSLGKTLTFENILVGDVWVLGGQSNMRWSLSTTTNAAEDIADADNYPNIRYYDQDQAANSMPQEDVVNGNWTVASSATASKYSGVGYLFGRELYKALGDVPIGLLSASYGGSRGEAWMSRDALEKDPRFLALDGRLSPTDIRRPTYLYNAMIHPLLKYNVKGVAFYQGEGNSYDGALYKDIFVALVNDWREKWNRPNLPFIYAQISASVPTNPNEQRPLVRQSQLEALDLLENAAMVVTMDIGTEDIHPPHKFPVAQRMALAARGMVYGHDVVYRSPSVESVTYNGNSATLKFKDVANGLDTSVELAEFVLVDSNGTKYSADAQFQGNDTIVVSAQGIGEIAQILYAFDDFPEKGVTVWSICDDGIRLPASPFRIIR